MEGKATIGNYVSKCRNYFFISRINSKIYLFQIARASQGRSGQRAYSILDILEERESELRAANNSYWFNKFLSKT